MAATVAMAVCLTTASAAAATLSVPEFEAQKQRWVDLELTVVGRWALSGRNQLKLRKCSVLFQSEGELPNFSRKKANMRLSGTLVRSGSRLVFKLSHVQEDPSDVDAYHARRRELKSDDAAAWHKLAAWARQLADFYDDDELAGLADEARDRGFTIERRQLPENDPAARLRLAVRATELGLANRLRDELVHESFVLRRAANLAAEKPLWSRMAKDLSEALPGTDVPPDADLAELREKYLKDPLSLYAAADAPTRLKLHRVLWSDAALRDIEARAQPDAANGFEIAAEIEQQVPEFNGLADKYRQRALAGRAEQAASLARSDAIALAAEFRDRQQPDEARRVLETWLALKRKQLDLEDAAGVLRLADDYVALLAQPAAAQRLLLEAIQKSPESVELGDRLRQAGYRFQAGKWWSPEALLDQPEDPLEKALREGRVEKGMAGSLVLKSLGAPGTSTRLATASSIQEVWTYGAPGASRLVLYLTRTRGAKDAKVVGIDRLGKAPAP